MTTNKTYLMYGAVALALLLIGVAVATYFATGDVTVVGGAGVAATVAAGEALRRRQETQKEVEAAKVSVADTAGKVAEIHEAAEADMKAEAVKVADASDDDKVADGNDLFA